MPEHARTHQYASLAPDEGELERAAAALMRLIDADSTSGREAAAVPVIEGIAGEIGLPSEVQSAGEGRDNVYVGQPQPELLLCTHYDTVPPFIPARMDGGTIWGRGACDAKGVAVAMLYGLHIARRTAPAIAAGCLLVVGEETDHLGARAAVRSRRYAPRHIVLGEPCGMQPSIGQKGLLKLRLSCRGKSAHSAYPELASSAVHRLVGALSMIIATRLPQDDTLGRTTVNVGQLTGGVAANVIAPSAEALLLIRCAAPVDAILAAIKDLAGPGVTVTEVSRSEPIDFDTLSADECGPAVPFNTDAGILSALGAPITLMGPGDMRTAHGDGEHLTMADLAEGIERYARALVQLS